MIRCSKGCEAIFHLETHIPKIATPDKAGHWAMNDSIRVEGTKTLLEAARQNGVKCFIQQSLAALYGDKNGAEVNTKTPIAGDQPFMLHSAVEMEKLVRQANYLDHQILRFAQFYSEDSFTSHEQLQAIRKGKLPIIGKEDYYWNYIHVDDAADAILYGYHNFDRLKNQTLHFSDFAPMKARDVLTGLAEITRSSKPRHFPSLLARLFLNKSLYKYLTASYKVTHEDAITDWQPKHKNFLEGVENILHHKKSV